VAVNALGSPFIPGTDVFWSWALEQDNEFGGRRPSKSAGEAGDLPSDMKGRARAGENTSIAIVATDAVLDRMELKRLAIMASDGFARALRPSHTPFDGDLVFALSTAKKPLAAGPRDVMRLGSLAADCMARAIARGVHEAVTLGTMKSCHDHFRK
jgi:L-aminopeptidase/D-esterase-like protein